MLFIVFVNVFITVFLVLFTIVFTAVFCNSFPAHQHQSIQIISLEHDYLPSTIIVSQLKTHILLIKKNYFLTGPIMNTFRVILFQNVVTIEAMKYHQSLADIC